MQEQTVVVIGGNGWLGSYLISLLVKIMKNGGPETHLFNENMRVHSVDVQAPRKEFQSLHDGETMNHICDISSKNMIHSLITKLNPTLIFHVASVIDLRVGPTPLMDGVNIDGTKHIIEALLSLPQDKIRYLVYTSSIDVVATCHGIQDANEDTPPVLFNPSNGYKRTKAVAENMILSINSESLRCCSLRPGHIFGPGDPISEQSATSPALGPSNARMAFTYVENTAYAHILAAYRLIEERYLPIKHLQQFPRTTIQTISTSLFSPLQRYSSLPYLTQTPLFIYDYNVNFCDMYHSFAHRSPSRNRVPIFLLSAIISIVEFLEIIFVRIFKRHILQPHPFLSITSSVLEACGPLTINSIGAHDLLPTLKGVSGATLPLLERIYQVVGRDEALKRTQYWVKTGKIRQLN